MTNKKEEEKRGTGKNHQGSSFVVKMASSFMVFVGPMPFFGPHGGPGRLGRVLYKSSRTEKFIASSTIGEPRL